MTISLETVHPRSRGEHITSAIASAQSDGSSPLARGTQSGGCRQGGSCRFIPARAGNTWRRPSGYVKTPVHPRSRGEHHRAPSEACSPSGSSPLARGTPHRQARHRPRARFIPARAGNTRRDRMLLANDTVHPRSRGEHNGALAPSAPLRGSSPLARGTRSVFLASSASARFIPARAGNTADEAAVAARFTVHPRSRGEHALTKAAGKGGFGSSPLARGTLDRRLALLVVERFIPARAGNTRELLADTGRGSVHPRSRGEHSRITTRAVCALGSSPLARGTRGRDGRRGVRVRFIPARAGNTCQYLGIDRTPPVHPRSRGEHTGQRATVTE